MEKVSNFEVSNNQYDKIHMLVSSTYGIWMSVKGSSTIFLYDDVTYECKLAFDTFLNELKNLENVMHYEIFTFNFLN